MALDDSGDTLREAMQRINIGSATTNGDPATPIPKLKEPRWRDGPRDDESVRHDAVTRISTDSRPSKDSDESEEIFMDPEDYFQVKEH